MRAPYRTPLEALQKLPDGAHLVCAPGLGAPTTVLQALDAASDGRDWTLSSGLLLGEYPFLDTVRRGALAYRTWHVMPSVRDLVAAGDVGFIPTRASQVARLLERRGVDVALVRVSPPDAAGTVSIGATASYAMDALRLAAIRVAEVDASVPRTAGDTTVPLDLFDHLVESETPIPSYASAKSNRLSTELAEAILALLPQDPTIQIGIGAVPETLVRNLAHHDLGTVRFVGMATDDMVDLFEAGVLSADGGPAVLSPDMMGTAKLLEFADGNPAIEMHPSSLSHDSVALAARYDRFASINTAIEVDLRGNVNNEVLGGRQISGIGGSLDYIDTALRSRDGMRIIALPSANSDGTVSRIVPALADVGVARSLVDVIVTEHGVARLDGLSTRERAEALVAIAHPDHRAALTEAIA